MLPLELAATLGAIDTEARGKITWNFDGSIDSINEIAIIVELLEVPLRKPLVISMQYPLVRVFSCKALQSFFSLSPCFGFNFWL